MNKKPQRREPKRAGAMRNPRPVQFPYPEVGHGNAFSIQQRARLT